MDEAKLRTRCCGLRLAGDTMARPVAVANPLRTGHYDASTTCLQPQPTNLGSPGRVHSVPGVPSSTMRAFTVSP